jgi:hypothetical protein
MVRENVEMYLIHLSLHWQNFALTIAEAQLNRQLVDENGVPNSMGDIFDAFDIFFICFFSVELLLNAFANWFRFVSSSTVIMSFVFTLDWCGGGSVSQSKSSRNALLHGICTESKMFSVLFYFRLQVH